MAVGCALLDLCGSRSRPRSASAPGWSSTLPEASLADVAGLLLATQWPAGAGARHRARTSACSRTPAGPPTPAPATAIARWEGYLAVAHTRMATESAVTVLHSHPFVPARDLCVVHNGSFSNYATVRRRLEADGVAFDSDNDSEVAARFLAQRLELGDDLEEATRWVMKEMDGFFTLVITDARTACRSSATPSPASRPSWPRRAGYVAVASEYRALAELPGIADAVVFEPQPEEVYTWSR